MSDKPLSEKFRAHVLESLAEGPCGFMRLYSTFRPPYTRGSASDVVARLCATGEIQQDASHKYTLPTKESANA